MVDTTQSVFELIGIVVVLAVGLGALFLVLNRRLKARIAELRGQADGRPEFVDDRSYNLLRLARAEAAALKREGYDVHAAEGSLADADAAIRRRDYDIAVQDARRAHELLVGLRKAGPTAAAPSSPSDSPLLPSRSMTEPTPTRAPRNPPSDSPPELARVADDGTVGEPAVPRLAKNRAESHFQLSLLNEEIAAATQSRSSDAALPEARSASTEAQSAYDRGDYTDAMRLALRGRRKLGTRIETLPPPTTRIPPSPPAMVAQALAGPSGTAPCIRCGRPLKPADRFCRSCGTPKAPTACPACGTAVDEGDRFCPACGTTVA